MFDGCGFGCQSGRMNPLAQLRATAHPVRLRMLSLVTASAMSAAEVARELNISQANASYHLRLLERAELVRVVETTRVRGGEAKRYRHESSAEPFTRQEITWGFPVAEADTFQHYISVLAAELARRAASQAAGARLTTDAELWLEPGDWADVVAAVGTASATMHAQARPPRTPGTIPVSMSAALFAMDTE